jgi:hypothetical protein
LPARVNPDHLLHHLRSARTRLEAARAKPARAKPALAKPV